MAERQEFSVGQLVVESRSGLRYPAAPSIVAGHCVTRATLIAEIDPKLAIGSIYLGTQGHVYIKVANTATPATTDWQVITSTAAD